MPSRIPSLRCTLVGDGPSDSALLPILEWVLRGTGMTLPLAMNWAAPDVIIRNGTRLADRLRQALEIYPCDLLFVHRDAEAQSPQNRRDEITAALAAVPTDIPAVCVVPVRMTEAWLLFDQSAIREAADNKHGSVALELPALRRLDTLPNPKQILNALLCSASEKNGRNLHKFQSGLAHRRARVVDLIEDFAPLRVLPAFQQVESDIRTMLQSNEWI